MNLNQPFDLPIGTILPYLGSEDHLPTAWLICDGRTITQSYSNLRDAIGSTTTPDLSGRMLLGEGTSGENPTINYALNSTAGCESSTISVSQGGYEHQVPTHSEEGGAGQGDGWTVDEQNQWTDNQSNTPDWAGTMRTMPPYLCVNFIIYAGQQEN